MYRLLIVDDEHHIVNWLVTLFSSIDDLELEIMKAYSGLEAMKVLENYRVDVLLLDIQMPGISGLEVAERTLSEWPLTHIVFLTAFEKFEYVYKANNLDNTSYLLKTESDTSIVSKVKEVIHQIEAEIENRTILAEANSRKLMLDHMMQQDFLRSFIHGNYSYQPNYSFALSKVPMPIDFSQEVYLFYTKISGGNYRKNIYKNAENTMACLSLISSLLYDKFHFCMLELDNNSMLWFFQYCGSPQKSIPIPVVSLLRNISEDFIGNADKLVHHTFINIFIEEPILPRELYTIVHQLQQYTLSNTRMNQNKISFSMVLSKMELEKNIASNQDSSKLILPTYAEELAFYLAQKDKEAYMELLADISAKVLHRTSMHDLLVIQLYSSIALSITQFINQYQLEKKLALKIAIYPLYYIHDFTSWETAFCYLTSLSEHVFSLVSDIENNRNEQLIGKVEKYIANNLSSSLTISEVASCINYNPTYVSRLFRQTRGISLSEYITQSRIKLACKLLTTTNESIQNIAYQTGFDTSQYFSIVFKKATGFSPRDFRNSH